MTYEARDHGGNGRRIISLNVASDRYIFLVPNKFLSGLTKVIAKNKRMCLRALSTYDCHERLASRQINKSRTEHEGKQRTWRTNQINKNKYDEFLLQVTRSHSERIEISRSRNRVTDRDGRISFAKI